jgi:hypothetical protein
MLAKGREKLIEAEIAVIGRLESKAINIDEHTVQKNERQYDVMAGLPQSVNGLGALLP